MELIGSMMVGVAMVYMLDAIVDDKDPFGIDYWVSLAIGLIGIYLLV